MTRYQKTRVCPFGRCGGTLSAKPAAYLTIEPWQKEPTSWRSKRAAQRDGGGRPTGFGTTFRGVRPRAREQRVPASQAQVLGSNKKYSSFLSAQRRGGRFRRRGRCKPLCKQERASERGRETGGKERTEERGGLRGTHRAWGLWLLLPAAVVQRKRCRSPNVRAWAIASEEHSKQQSVQPVERRPLR